MKRFVTCALVIVAIGAVSTSVTRGQPKVIMLSGTRGDVLRLTNVLRTENGVRPPLRQSDTLDEVARRYARLMAEKDQMDHSLDGKDAGQRIAAAGYSASYWAENIANHTQLNDRHKAAFVMWANSKTHRENMLNRQFTEMGSGFAVSKTGKCYYCQVFATPRPARLPPAVAPPPGQRPPKLP